MSKPLILKDGIWQSEETTEIFYPHEATTGHFKVEENSFWFKHRNNCLLEAVKRFPPNGDVYDVGGGNGCMAAHLQNNGFPAVLIEPEPSGAVNARTRGVKTIVCATLENSNLPKQSLAAIGNFDVVEHIKDDKEFLVELKDYLRADGRLYIMVPAFTSLWSAKDIYMNHFRRYSLKSLTKVLKEAGFSVEYATYLFSFLYLPIFLLNSLPFRLGLKKANAGLTAEGHDQKNFLLDRSLAWELAKVKKGGHVPFGSSCLAVAKKIS